jgi:hypothetical protein
VSLTVSLCHLGKRLSVTIIEIEVPVESTVFECLVPIRVQGCVSASAGHVYAEADQMFVIVPISFPVFTSDNPFFF